MCRITIIPNQRDEVLFIGYEVILRISRGILLEIDSVIRRVVRFTFRHFHIEIEGLVLR